VRNLFNVDYAFPAGFDHLQPAIPQDGRSFIAKIELKY
jgi:outer membrane receptor protein involved in Fe transport